MYRLLTIIMLSLATVLYLPAQSGWEKLSQPTTDALSDVAFTSAQRGYVISYLGTAWQTVDGGLTWSPMALPSVGQPCYTICFTDRERGFIGGGSGQQPALLMSTTDGGINWQSYPFDSLGSIMDIDFPTPMTGYATGNQAQSTQRTLMVKTTDAGTTWSYLPLSTDASIFSVGFADELEGMVVMLHLIQPGIWEIRRTTDGGTSWQTVQGPLPTDAYLGDVYHVEGNSWLLGSGRGIYKSDDDGGTWRQVLADQWISFEFADNRRGYAVSEEYDNTIAHTTDGGSTWNVQTAPVPSHSRIRAVSAPEASVAYAVGDSGLILKTTATGIAGIAEPVTYDAGSLQLTSGMHGSIEARFPASISQRLIIVSELSGEMVARIEIEPGMTSLALPIDAMPSGIYWCRLGSSRAASFVIAR
jgi:photosystem II stability/assembly factor-like uncharacterized protein